MKFLLTRYMPVSVAIVFSLAACSKDEAPDYTIVSATGDITARVNEFRQLLGDPINTIPGATGGRREINWDGIPTDLVGKTLPADFFNPVGESASAARQRGIAYASGQNFQISSNSFSSVNEGSSSQFKSFSGDKVFANLSSAKWDVFMEVPGQRKTASVKGFGLVFSDVDLANSTSLEFFDGNKSLGKFFVPAHDNNSSFSFLGVYFHKDRVTKITVTHDGLLTDGSKDISLGGNHDLVVVDDFLYDEPREK